MLVSVIIPNYNHAPYLVQRIESVFNQTYQDFEVIFLDDCSTDNSRDIIEQYRNHPKVSHILYNEVNSGSTFKQWEKGFELAKHDWIWIAESDDLCAPDFLEVLVVQIRDGVSLVTCRTEKIDKCDNLLQPGYFLADDVQPGRWHSDFENEGINEVNLALKYRCTLPNASAVIFHKSLTKYVEFSLGFKAAGDWFFWINCLKEARIKYVAQPLAFHRFHSQTTRCQKSVIQEKGRMHEFLACINLAHEIIAAGNKRNSIDLKQYKWLYFELFEREHRLNEIFKYNRIPFKFIYGYWYYINKRTNRFKKIPQKIKLKFIFYIKWALRIR
jgi:glycosyltransferase involved in cell wall biosynthesis